MMVLLLGSAAGHKFCSGSGGKDQDWNHSQIVEHPALDAARQGFIDELAGSRVRMRAGSVYDMQNAPGGFQHCPVTIAEKFVSSAGGSDLGGLLLLPRRRRANVTQDIPILILL